MIFVGTRLSVFDNSGGRLVECIKVKGVGRRKFARAGDIIKVSLKTINPRKKLLTGQVLSGVVVSTVKQILRPGGEAVRFDRNGVVLINDKKLPIGTRVLSAVMLEVRLRGFVKVVSLSKETI